MIDREQIIHYTEWFRNYLTHHGMGNFWATLLNTILIALWALG